MLKKFKTFESLNDQEEILDHFRELEDDYNFTLRFPTSTNPEYLDLEIMGSIIVDEHIPIMLEIVRRVEKMSEWELYDIYVRAFNIKEFYLHGGPNLYYRYIKLDLNKTPYSIETSKTTHRVKITFIKVSKFI